MNSDKGILWPFMRHFRQYIGKMALGALLALAAVGAATGLLALSGWFLTAAAVAGLTLATAAGFNFFLPSIGVRLFAFARTLARYGERIFSHDATFRILAHLRTWFFECITPLVPSVLSRYRSGDVLNRAVEDIDTLDNLYLRVLTPVATAMVVVLALVLFLWFYNASMALSALAVLAPAGLVPLFTALRGNALGRELATAGAALRTRIVETLQGLPELLAYGADGRYLAHIRRDNQSLFHLQRRMAHAKAVASGALTLLSGLAAALVLYVGIAAHEAGNINGAFLAMAVLAVMASFEAFWPLPNAFLFLGRTRQAARRLIELTRMPPSVCFPSHTKAPPASFDLAFEAVAFQYGKEGPPVLHTVTFIVDAGCRAVVLGASGSGKTTLANLLVRFWDPDRGRILIGGCDVRTISESDLRRWVCLISQQAHIFNATLRDNLLIANPEASEQTIRKALDDVGLLDFVETLPEGLDTFLGEAGRRLSGGQARRLAVARAFVHDAPVWVLDEPTEGLDRITAKALTEAIMLRTRHRTVLWISHRQVALAQMDAVILLAEGRVVYQGGGKSLSGSSPYHKDLPS